MTEVNRTPEGGSFSVAGRHGAYLAPQVGSGAVREILVVLALALAGLLLAVAAAFGPWYPALDEPTGAAVVEMHAPVAPGSGAGAGDPAEAAG